MLAVVLLLRRPCQHEGRAPASLTEVEQGRLGVLSSTDAYLFHLKETRSSSPTCGKPGGPAQPQLPSGDGAGGGDVELHVVYLWFGREAGAEACSAVRAQVGFGELGNRLCSVVIQPVRRESARWIR